MPVDRPQWRLGVGCALVVVRRPNSGSILRSAGKSVKYNNHHISHHLLHNSSAALFQMWAAVD